MSWFCRHRTILIERLYAPPSSRGFQLDGADPVAIRAQLIRQFAFGVTTLVFQCTKCHTLTKLECLGVVLPASSIHAQIEDRSDG